MGNNITTNNLKPFALIVLFLTSYLPLFMLIMIRQISNNKAYLVFGGINKQSIMIFIEKFGLSAVLGIISIFSLIGLKILLANLHKNADNGDYVTVSSLQNRNSEAIGYIATYIVPFVFSDFSSIFDIFLMIFIMLIIYRIYIYSNMIAINPILNFKYSIYEISYKDKIVDRSCVVISDNRELQENDKIKIYEIGYKIFFSPKESLRQ